MISPHYAGFWRRAAAHLIDSLVLNLVAWILQLFLTWTVYAFWSVWAERHGQTIPPYEDAFNATGLYAFSLGLYLVIAFPYFVGGAVRYGTTLGKRPFHIYVVADRDLEPVSVKQAVLRFVGYLPSYVFFGVGFLMVGLNPKKQGLHDLIAGTVSIVRPPRARTAEELRPPIDSAP